MKLKTLLWCFVCTVFTTLQAQNLLITELTDPQNSSDAGRYVEIFNSGTEDIDLSIGYSLVRWTNANLDTQTPALLTGSITAGDFYVVCNDGDKFLTTYGIEASQDIGTGGPADSNGDDNIALLAADGSIIFLEFQVKMEQVLDMNLKMVELKEFVEQKLQILGLLEIGLLIMIVEEVMEINMLQKGLILLFG